MKGFIDFIREQGVVGLAVGFILGGAISKVVTSLVNDVVNPLIGLALGTKDLQAATLHVYSAEVLWGNFVSVLIDFLIIALVVYIGVRIIGFERIDKKKLS